MGINSMDWTWIDGGRHPTIINNKEADSNAKRIHKGSTMVAYMVNKKIVFLFAWTTAAACSGCRRAACTWTVHATDKMCTFFVDASWSRWIEKKEEPSLGKYVVRKERRMTLINGDEVEEGGWWCSWWPLSLSRPLSTSFSYLSPPFMLSLVLSLFSLTHSLALLCSFSLLLPMGKKSFLWFPHRSSFSPASLIQRREGGLEMKIHPLVGDYEHRSFFVAGRSKMKQGSKGERGGKEERSRKKGSRQL